MICIVNSSVNSNVLDSNLELILSIIAIVISLIAIVFEFWGNQRINKINLEAKFYEEIYNDFLLDKLPNARNKLVYNNNIVSGTDTLIDILNDLRRKSIFFKYRDKKFYLKLCELLQRFEDELVKKSDKYLEDDEYCRFTDSVKKSMEEVYAIILNKYTGRIFGKKR